jgi:hypothetical protein
MTHADATSDRHEDLASRAAELERDTYADDHGRDHCTWCRQRVADDGACDNALCVCADCDEPCRGDEDRHTALSVGGVPELRCSACVCERQGHDVSSDDDGFADCDRCGHELGYQQEVL